MAEDWQNGGFAAYVHWPFCAAKCPYCDFNSHVSRSIDQKRWLDAYVSEIDRYAEEVGGRTLTSIFFGGGTPSLMDPDVVKAVIDRLRLHWPAVNNLEVTLEANPGSVESGRFRAYSEAGVNRISMGIQSLRDDDLRRLGRIHTVEEAKKAFDIARNQFERVSLDLIYARQQQTPEEWRKELAEALSMTIDHLSLYQLTIEEGTAFADRYKAGKLRDLPAEDSASEMYEITQEICERFGMPAYEISNHAKAGAESQHNIVYWRYGDYLGIGPGAHGRLTLGGTRNATEGFREPGRWLAAVGGGSGESVRDVLEAEDAASEFLLMGLRLRDGIDAERFERISGRPLNAERLGYLLEIGMVECAGATVRATDSGRMVLDAVIGELLR